MRANNFGAAEKNRTSNRLITNQLLCLLSYDGKRRNASECSYSPRRTLLWRCGVSRGRHTFRPHFVFCVLDFGSNPTILILRMTVAHSCISWLALQVTLLCTSGQSRMHYYCAKRQCIARLSELSAVCCVFVEVHRNSLFRVSCFRWSRAQRSPNPKRRRAETLFAP